MKSKLLIVFTMVATAVVAFAAPEQPAAIGHPSFLSPHVRPIAIHGRHVFVANTPADTLDVIDRASRKLVRRIDVGIDPVCVAVRPDGREIWVANHVSDSVSVIDLESGSPTRFQVIATVQDLEAKSKSTRFDEPVGIAFANNKKAYVALSSENKIAVIDVLARKVTKSLNITAQDPRAIVVRGDRLYVIPFESNNKTQLSGGAKEKIDGDLVTFDAWEHAIRANNVLSIGYEADIVKHPRVPDRDLYVFDTKTDRLVKTVDTLGTLLYGMALDSKGRVFIAQTDARNDANGRAGTQGHGLKELENRAFLNRITVVDFDGDNSSEPRFIDLEPLPPNHPEPDQALATPFAIQVSDDGSTLFATAAGADKFFAVDVAKGKVLGRVAVGSVPRGIALESDPDGRPERVWVLNAVDNSVSIIEVDGPEKLRVETTIELDDPTHPAFKRGRIAFNRADASTTGTFSCASCHPDGHTDQLLWVLQTPVVTGGDQIMPRSTMPVRGLRDTEPYHWDGIPGDPYGGINSASVRKHVPPNCDVNVPESATRHLIDGGLAATMRMDGDTTQNDEGKAGRLTAKERDDLAKFLLNVTYPPAQRRAYDNELSAGARRGFELFNIIGDIGNKPGTMHCGNCHRMPFWTSTNTRGSGMDAPTWRGANDRYLILPQGRLNVIAFPFYRRIADGGQNERDIWRMSWSSRPAFDPVWNMVLEGSTGFSGSFGRQTTLNKSTATEGHTAELLSALEGSASESGVVLQVEGTFIEGKAAQTTKLQFRNGVYFDIENPDRTYARKRLVQLASNGRFVGTFTGRHGENDDYDHPQPALWTRGPIHSQRGKQKFPKLYGDNRTMKISGRHIREGAHIIVNGRRVSGTIHIAGKDDVDIVLNELPEYGLHFVQVQNPDGLFSNDFIFHVTAGPRKVAESQAALEAAVALGNIEEVKRLIARGAKINALAKESGSPMSTAAYHGHMGILRMLLADGGNPNYENRDGNTPLHVAAFAGEIEIVKFLLNKGASLTQRNRHRQTAVEIVSGEWNEETAGVYRAIGAATGRDFDLDHIRKVRPQIAQILNTRLKK